MWSQNWQIFGFLRTIFDTSENVTGGFLALTTRRSNNSARSRQRVKKLGWSGEYWSCVRVNYKHSSVLAALVLQNFSWFDCVEKEYFILTRCSSLSLQLYFDCMYKKIKLFFMRLRLRREIVISCWPLFLVKNNPKTHIKRQAISTTACPGWGAMGKNKVI
jgi:hypothetical protein